MEAASSPTGPRPGLASPSCTKAGRGEAAPPSLAPCKSGRWTSPPNCVHIFGDLPPSPALIRDHRSAETKREMPMPVPMPPFTTRGRASPPEGRGRAAGGSCTCRGEAVAECSLHLQEADGSLRLQGWWRVTGNPRPGSQFSPAPLPAPFPLVEGLVWRHWPALPFHWPPPWSRGTGSGRTGDMMMSWSSGTNEGFL